MKTETISLLKTFKLSFDDLQSLLISIGIIPAALVLGLLLQKILSFILSRRRRSHLAADLREDLTPESWRGPLRALLPALLIMLGTVFLYADYTVPVQEIREELQRILQDTPLWDQRVNVLQVTDASERTVELRALMSAVDSSTAWSLRCHVREKLIEFMQRNFPQHLPQVRVEMERQ